MTHSVSLHPLAECFGSGKSGSSSCVSFLSRVQNALFAELINDIYEVSICTPVDSEDFAK